LGRRHADGGIDEVPPFALEPLKRVVEKWRVVILRSAATKNLLS